MELIAAFDWDRVLTQALIGGVIGGVVGLCIAIFKKKTPPPPTDAMDDKDRPESR